jgi:hypothetical protein
MTQFAMDVELVGGPECGTTIPEIPEDTDMFPVKYKRLTKKGEQEYEALYRADANTGKAYYVKG